MHPTQRGHDDPLEQHRPRLRVALVGRVAVRAGGGAVGDHGPRVIVLASWKIIRIVT